MGRSKIEWTEQTWNPVTGCSHSGSPGCDHCYAARMASGRLKHHPHYKGLAENGRWTGEPPRCHPEMLREPLRWRKERMIFVCSMSDLFHPQVPMEFRLQVLDLGLFTPHIYQFLTKRVGEMRSTFEAWWDRHRGMQPHPRHWLGVSVEGPGWLWRIHELLKIPAAVHFVSLEPLLDAVDIRPWLHGWNVCDNPNCDWIGHDDGDPKHGTAFPCPECGWDTRAVPIDELLDWVIAGCESGPNRRPSKTNWFRSLRDQCLAAGVPFFLKQMDIGGRLVKRPLLDGDAWEEIPG